MTNNNKNNKSFLFVYLKVLNACLGSFYFGYSVAILNLSQSTIFEVLEVNSQIVKSFCNANVPIGALLGVIFSGLLLPQFSRRHLLMILDFIGAIGCIICAIPNLAVFLVGRIIVGMATGLNSLLVPIYINEVSPPSISGTTGSLNAVLINLGLIVAYVTGYGFVNSENNGKTDPNHYWQLIVAFPVVTCLLRTLLLICVFKQDTASYYIQQKMMEQARVQLEIMYSEQQVQAKLNENTVVTTVIDTQDKEDSTNASYSLRGIQGSDSEVFRKQDNPTLLQKNQVDQNSYRGMFSRVYSRRLLIGVNLQFLQQFCGINAVIFYSSQIFGDITTSNMLITTLTVLVGVVGATFNMICGYLTQFIGRQTLLAAGTFFGGVFAMVGLGLLTGNLFDSTSLVQNLSIVFVFFYIICFQLSLGPLAWVYNAEILPEKGVTLATMANWIGVVIITFTFTLLVDAITISNCYYLFAGFSFIGLLFIFFYVEETKGLSSNEIQQIFAKKIQ